MSYGRYHILVVDDDRRIRELLKTFLGENGFRVSGAASATEARERLNGMQFDLIILDVMLPGEDGFSIARTLRRNNDDVPILMLSALTDTADRIKGLSSGSDDYLSKPFEPQELLLRIHNILKRIHTQDEQVQDVYFGSFSFNIQRAELKKNGNTVRLTSREKELLRILAASAGLPVSRVDLAPSDTPDTARSVDVQITRLRQKIETDPAEPQWLQTVRGQGYILAADNG